MGIHSTFIVKQNLNYFPMQVLHSILLARFPRHPAGHWVVMKAKISGINIFIMAYAWSNKGISYMVSSSGTTVRHETDYRSSFSDGFGNTDSKALPRPAVAHFLYEFLPLIDEHNKTRQSNLALERKWPTKCCWFQLMTTFIGIAVVDLQRWDRNMRGKNQDSARSLSRIFEKDKAPIMNSDIIEMADLIAKCLRSETMHFRKTPQPTA